MRNNLSRRSGAVERAGAREVAAIDRSAARGAYRVRNQVDKEIAAANAIANVCAATEALPADIPARQRRLAERIAVSTSRLAGRLAR